MGETEVARVVYEPTGPYLRGVERALAGAGLPLARVNPRQARRFAEATGRLAKTDLKAKYVRLIAAGKPPKVAITAVIRKLLILANALLRDRRRRMPNLP